MANNGELTLRNLGGGRVPVAGLYLGLLSNYQTTTVSCPIKVNGDLTNVQLSGPSNLGSASFSLTPFDTNTGSARAVVTVNAGAAPGSFQGAILVNRSGTLVGKIIATVVVMDLEKPNTDDLVQVNPLGGVLQLLQVSQDDFTVDP